MAAPGAAHRPKCGPPKPSLIKGPAHWKNPRGELEGRTQEGKETHTPSLFPVSFSPVITPDGNVAENAIEGDVVYTRNVVVKIMEVGWAEGAQKREVELNAPHTSLPPDVEVLERSSVLLPEDKKVPFTFMPTGEDLREMVGQALLNNSYEPS